MLHYSTHAWQKRGSSTATPERPIAARRQWAIGGVLAVVLVGLTGRLTYWQVFMHADLSARANLQHMQSLTLPSGRGMITDRNGTLLALTVTGDAIIIDPFAMQAAEKAQSGAFDRITTRIAVIANIAPDVVRPQLLLPTGYHAITDAMGATVHLQPTVSEQFTHAIDAERLVGISLEPQSWRVAPNGALASQVLGFVRGDTGAGQYGIEQQYDHLLAGTPGQFLTAVDRWGNPIASAPQHLTPAIPGGQVTLTLDANIQVMAEQGLQQTLATTGAVSGTVIIEDPQTGEILALANAPGFDPNHYETANQTDFADASVAHIYDPGSTMKALTMAMGIDSQVITPQTTFEDPGYFTIGNQTIYNWNKLSWGTETMTQVLTHSANVGAAWVAVDQLGHDRFARYLSAFGFGAPTGLALPGETAGLLPPPATNSDLQNLDLAENAFGESIGVTPLQMVMAYGALANGGALMRPQLVASTTNDGKTQRTPPAIVHHVITQQTAATITQMLVDSALHSDAQTGLIDGYTVAAKTGTSTPNPSDPTQTYASVLGYAPADHARYVVLVKIDHPQSSVFGGAAAGPLWRSLVRQLMAYSHVPAPGGN